VEETFGRRLRRIRKRRGYTLAALAQDAETDLETLLRLELDGGADMLPDVRLGVRLAFVLSVCPWRLAFGTDEPLASEHPRTAAYLDAHEARHAAKERG
jgi:transcriptional regulator with XRE-family HTH domain